jgi:alpha-1,3-rhamnosyl/mannosyltransferase
MSDGGGLRIGFDMITPGSVVEEGAGGAAGYYHGITPHLFGDERVEELVMYVPSWYPRVEEWEHPKVRVVRCRVPKQRHLRVLYEHLVEPVLATAHRLDVLYSGCNYRPLLYRGCNVVGLHSIQLFLIESDIGTLRQKYLEFVVPRSHRSGDLTIACTETVAADAVKLFDLDPERVVTVPMGPSPWVAELLERQAGDPPEPYRTPSGDPYLLCISRLYKLKNHERLIRAYARFVREHDAPHRLVIVGGDADITQEELREIAAEEGVADRLDFLGLVPQDAVPGLYTGASAIAYVSLYETFGHPVLEAFAMETPLLTSSRGATAEVAGGGARLVDPEDVDDIAAGIADVLLDDELRARLAAAGRERVRDFSWEACGRETIDYLEQAVERRRREGRRRATQQLPKQSST